MKKRFIFGCLFLLLFPKAWANELYNAALGYAPPTGDIAFLGSLYEFRKIWDTGSNSKYLRSPMVQIPPASQAVSEVQAALLKNATKYNLAISASPIGTADQKALLLHTFRPAEGDKYPFSPEKLSTLAGGKPYALVAIIDYYGTFGCPVNVRESMNGQKINYFHKRSILEKDGGLFTTRGFNKVGAMELFLFSTKDGALLWQANGSNSFQHTILNSFWDAANHEMDQFLKNMAGKK